MDGILNVLKPPGMTSHDVIYWVRKTLGIKKAGHTGTLDPGAAGVLPVCLGRGTKIIPYMKDEKKVYRAKIVFGQTTTTQDKYGQVLKQSSPDFSLQQFNKVLDLFLGKIQQKPPIFSAIRVDGKRLYKYARQEEKVDIPIREVTIYNIKLFHHNIPKYAFIEIECSKGTYIRTLCSDIGEKLGCGAYLGFLLRTEANELTISTSSTLEEIELKYKNGKMDDILYPPSYMLRSYPKIYIKDSAKISLENGNIIYPKGIINDLNRFKADSIVGSYINNQLSAIGKIQYNPENKQNYFKPLRVLL